MVQRRGGYGGVPQHVGAAVKADGREDFTYLVDGFLGQSRMVAEDGGGWLQSR